MGEREFFQPLTRWDRISVVLYRSGIVLSMLFLVAAAFLSFNAAWYERHTLTAASGILILLLYVSAGLSVFFIHLYVGKFHRALKGLYYVALAALVYLFAAGGGDILEVLAGKHYGPLLLLPLAGCLGFIAAKEAFCFMLIEGYLLAAVMPLYLIILAARSLTDRGVSYGLIFIAVLFAVFTFRKVFMPIHFDIGDKSAYI